MRSKKTEPIQHLSNLSKVIESSFKKDQSNIDEVLPKFKFPVPNELRNIDNIIFENYKENKQKFLTWNSKKVNFSENTSNMDVTGNKKITDLRKELDDLNDIARNKYGINIPQTEKETHEVDPKNFLFKLQPEFLNSKILNYDVNSNQDYRSANISHHFRHESRENIEKGQIVEENNQDSSVPEFLLQNVFLANQEMKNFRFGKPQSQMKSRSFKSQNSMRNPYKTKSNFNFASTFSGNFMKPNEKT